jgi:integrase/recombinase XerD
MVWLREDYKPRTGRPLTPSSRENAWKAFRSFFNFATEDLGFKKRPDKKLKRPRYKPPAIIPFTKEDLQQLLNATEKTVIANTERRVSFRMDRPTAARDRAIVLILLDTGLRVSELARLNIENVDLETGEVIILPYGSGQKTRPRSIFMGRKARVALYRYLSEREDAHSEESLFLSQTGRPMNRDSIRLMLRRLGERAGVSNVYAHRFRHTFAIQYLRNEGDVFTLQRILGHSTLDMVKRYIAVATVDVKNAHRKASPADR